MLRFILSIIIITSVFVTKAQLKLDTLGWISPVDIPILLSGNFAELRSDHFHAGIDIKTQGKEGFKLYAVQDGYISRIKVTPGGYGKAIYIVHPDGYTSVYAHLKEFNIQLDRYVKKRQYERQSFSVDVFPEKWELPVKQGEIIGLSGNSGSSAGPHLHFEIRDTRTSKPMNGLFLGYDIEDNIPPRMYHLYAYPQGNYSLINSMNKTQVYSLEKVNGSYKMKQNDTLDVYGSIGFGLKVNEYLNNSNNRCGVYYLNLYVDGVLHMQQEYNEFSFSETRYINSLMDYEENVSIKRKLYKMYQDPGSNLSVFKTAVNRGVVSGKKGDIKAVRVEAIDAYGNKSELNYFLNFKGEQAPKLVKRDYTVTIPWQESFEFDSSGFKASFLAKSFYDTVFMKYHVNNKRWPGTFSSVYTLHNRTTPVHKYFEIEVPVDSVDSVFYDKLILAQIVKHDYKAVGGLYANGLLKAKVRSFGKYVVLIDSISPTIKPLDDLETKTDLTGVNTIRFLIDDEFSGISSYSGTINGNWVLFEWDPKNRLVTYHVDEYMPIEGFCNLELKVIDGRGNETIFQKEFEIYAEPDHDIGQ